MGPDSICRQVQTLHGDGDVNFERTPPSGGDKPLAHYTHTPQSKILKCHKNQRLICRDEIWKKADEDEWAVSYTAAEL